MSSRRMITYITAASVSIAVFASYAVGAVAQKPPVKKPMVTGHASKPKVVKPLSSENKLLKPNELQPIAKDNANVPGQLALSPTADTGAQLYNSWPLILSVSLWRKAPMPDKNGRIPTLDLITIKAKSGSWREALILGITDSSGVKVNWIVHPVKNTEASLTLGVDDTATAQWWLDPSETQSLAVGQYKITASFDPKLVDGLPSDVWLDDFYLNVSKEPSPLDSDTANDKQIQIAMLAILKDDLKGAGDVIDKVLINDPDSIGGNRLKSTLLLHEGKEREAVDSMDKAIHGYYKKYPSSCPPAGLFTQRDEILKDMEPEQVKPDESDK